jgi:hypothetical protein
VLIYTPIPTANAAAANIVLGQTDFVTDAPTDGADTMDAPSSLAWDGSNLYVADTYNQRVLVYTMAEQDLPYNAVLNSFSTIIYAIDPVTIGGTIKAGDTVELTIGNSTTTTTAFLHVYGSKRRHLYHHRGWAGGADQRRQRRSERHRQRGYASR